MLGVAPLRSGRQVGRCGTMQLLGEPQLQLMYNDGTNSSRAQRQNQVCNVGLAERKQIHLGYLRKGKN
jgi:hypothetical protein